MITILAILTVFLILAVFIPLVHNDYWLFKVLEYPRLQKLVLVLLVLGGWVVYWPLDAVWQQVMFWTLCVAALYLVYKIGPYTTVLPKEMKTVTSYEEEHSLRIFSAKHGPVSLKMREVIHEQSCHRVHF